MANILIRKTLAFTIIILFVGLSINSLTGSITTKNVTKVYKLTNILTSVNLGGR